MRSACPFMQLPTIENILYYGLSHSSSLDTLYLAYICDESVSSLIRQFDPKPVCVDFSYIKEKLVECILNRSIVPSSLPFSIGRFP